MNLHKNMTNLRKALKNKEKKYIIYNIWDYYFLGGKYERKRLFKKYIYKKYYINYITNNSYSINDYYYNNE